MSSPRTTMKVGPYDHIKRTPTTKGGTSMKRIKQARAAANRERVVHNPKRRCYTP